MNRDRRILIIDDEENIRKYLGYSLAKDGYEVQTAQYGKEGLSYLVQQHMDVVLLDLNLPDISGLELLREIKRIDVQVVVIIITAYGDISTAVQAMKLGAFDYLTKPFEVDDIRLVIDKALRVIGLEDRIQVLERQVDRYQYGELITRSRKMFDILDFVESIAKTTTTVIVYGETGTGKELIAGLLHKESPKAREPFVTIDCTSLPENLLESELFGHEKGAFTGAIRLKRGLFEVADGGTIFLDEIGELPLMLQAKILRVLDSKSFRRVGGDKTIVTNVRIVAATNRDLKELVLEKRFRSDLFFRLNVVPVYLPPLRERREDIFPLIEFFIGHFNKKIGRRITNIANQAVQTLVDYDWPGNIRELKNVIEHIVITCRGDMIHPHDLPDQISALERKDGRPLKLEIDSELLQLQDFRQAKKKLIEDFESKYLRELLNKNNWNVAKSARDIQMHRSSFQRLIRKYAIRKNR